MKKIFHTLLCVFLLVGCSHQSNGNNGTSSTISTTSPIVTTTPVVTTVTTTAPKPKYPQPEYHDKLMKGDFSSIAGQYVNIKGEVIKLNENGLRDEQESIHGDVCYLENLGIYQRSLWWGDQAEGGYAITIYPVGVKVDGVYTNTTILRISYGQAAPMTEDEIFYYHPKPLPEYHEQLMAGDFSAITGEYVNPSGDIFYLNDVGGVSEDLQIANIQYRNGVYSMNVYVKDIDGWYGHLRQIYSEETEVQDFNTIIESDTSKIRITSGHDYPSSNDVYTKKDEVFTLKLGTYIEDDDEYPTTFTLYEDNTLELNYNFCHDLSTVNGTYEIVNNVLIIDAPPYATDVDGNGWPMHAEFEITSNTTFKYIPYTFSTNQKRESFSCRFVDTYTLQEE